MIMTTMKMLNQMGGSFYVKNDRGVTREVVEMGIWQKSRKGRAGRGRGRGRGAVGGEEAAGGDRGRGR